MLAAGEGSRLRPLTFSRPKHLIPLLGKPMIRYPVEDLFTSGIKDIGVVVGYFGDLIIEALGDGSTFGVRFTYIKQERRLGIAHAIHRAIEEGFLDKDFVVYLGDNILSSGISMFVKKFQEGGGDVHILLTKVRDPQHFGVAVVRDGRIVKLVEKPRDLISDLAVIGVYFFRDPDIVERAFRGLKPSWRGEYEITELIQWFIDHSYNVSYSVISGWWKDVGTYEGLLNVIYLLLDRSEGIVRSKEVEGEVEGRVIIEDGAIVRGRVYGPAYIGRNTIIDKNAVVEHYVSVEHSTKVTSGHITRSLILNNTELDLNKARIVDSVIGCYCKVRCSRELHGDLKLTIFDYSSIIL